MWNRNCLPFRSTWVQPRSLLFFFGPLCCPSVFDLRLFINTCPWVLYGFHLNRIPCTYHYAFVVFERGIDTEIYKDIGVQVETVRAWMILSCLYTLIMVQKSAVSDHIGFFFCFFCFVFLFHSGKYSWYLI
jgi:hypothetical protein